jgi:hypothetical protein
MVTEKLLGSIMKIYVYQELQAGLSPDLYVLAELCPSAFCAALGEF